MGRPHQTHRPRQSRGPLVPPAGCRFAPTPGSGCFSGRCEPHPGTIPRLVHRVVVPPGLALIAIPELRKLRLCRRIGLRMARPRRQPAQLHPVQQPVGARQAAFNRKLVFQYSLRVDPTKRHHPIPRQLGASDNPFLEPRARHGVDPWLSTRARPVAQSLKAILFIAVVPLVGRRPAQTSQPRRFLMLHPLEHVGDHQNPLAHTPALASCQAPQLRRPRFAAKEVCRHRLSPQTWYTCLITLPHLGITGSRYEMSAVPFKANADRRHHIPKQQDRVTNWSEYDAALRQRGSLTVWFTEEAIAA